MSSLVVFPFKSVEVDLVLRNLTIAATHHAVEEVLGVGTEGATTAIVAETAGAIESETDTRVSVAIQERIGIHRPGKGDAMNTAMRRFLDSSHRYLHFYDADITNFDHDWIDAAESAATGGFDVVRHYFPRASTDAMITWMVTRPGFALAHPTSLLWRIAQPLGGELLMVRSAVEHLVSDPRVAERSDWGIDTMITFATVAAGLDIAEVFITDGKQHSLYGSLEDLRLMVVECFAAMASIRTEPLLSPGRYHVEPSAPAGDEVTTKVGYSLETTLPLLTDGWSDDEVELAVSVPFGHELVRNRDSIHFEFADGDCWREILSGLLDLADPANATWQSVIFRFWVARVLAYTTTTALGGHGYAMGELETLVSDYAAGAV